MSTRANIIIQESFTYNDKDGNEVTQTEKLFFYRHSDGYPDGTMPTLKIFMDWLKSGKIRQDVGQGAGWLIIIGAMEYNHIPEYKLEQPTRWGTQYGNISTIKEPKDWKVGSYEPTTEIHGDIEYLYVIDMKNKSIKCYNSWDDEGNGKDEVSIENYLS